MPIVLGECIFISCSDQANGDFCASIRESILRLQIHLRLMNYKYVPAMRQSGVLIEIIAMIVHFLVAVIIKAEEILYRRPRPKRSRNRTKLR